MGMRNTIQPHRANAHRDIGVGVFTPTFGDTDGEGTNTYTLQNGVYQRVGDWVTFQLDLTINSLGDLTAGDGARIEGFPYNFRNTTGQAPYFAVWGSSLALPVAQDTIGALGILNTNRIEFYIWEATGGPNAALVSEISAGAVLHITGVYEREDPGND